MEVQESSFRHTMQWNTIAADAGTLAVFALMLEKIKPSQQPRSSACCPVWRAAASKRKPHDTQWEPQTSPWCRALSTDSSHTEELSCAPVQPLSLALSFASISPHPSTAALCSAETLKISLLFLLLSLLVFNLFSFRQSQLEIAPYISTPVREMVRIIPTKRPGCSWLGLWQWAQRGRRGTRRAQPVCSQHLLSSTYLRV